MPPKFVIPTADQLKIAKQANAKLDVLASSTQSQQTQQAPATSPSTQQQHQHQKQPPPVPSRSLSITRSSQSQSQPIKSTQPQPQPQPPPTTTTGATTTTTTCASICTLASTSTVPTPPPTQTTSAPTTSAAPPTPPITATTDASNFITASYSTDKLVASFRQQRNPILSLIRHVPMEFANIAPDFIAGDGICVLFLSLQYHALHPTYIHTRINDIGRQYRVRVLLVLVDVDDNTELLAQLGHISCERSLSMLLSWSRKEAARYLETLKAYEHKSADVIKPQVSTDTRGRAAECLLAIPSVNKTDASTLLRTFGTLATVMNASMEELLLCPGLGEKKVRRIYDAFHEPFICDRAKKDNSLTLIEDNDLNDSSDDEDISNNNKINNDGNFDVETSSVSSSLSSSTTGNNNKKKRPYSATGGGANNQQRSSFAQKKKK